VQGRLIGHDSNQVGFIALNGNVEKSPNQSDQDESRTPFKRILVGPRFDQIYARWSWDFPFVASLSTKDYRISILLGLT